MRHYRRSLLLVLYVLLEDDNLSMDKSSFGMLLIVRHRSQFVMVMMMMISTGENCYDISLLWLVARFND
jgi:hypothetical protein